jgi:hypothetical protein
MAMKIAGTSANTRAGRGRIPTLNLQPGIIHVRVTIIPTQIAIKKAAKGCPIINGGVMILQNVFNPKSIVKV